MYSITINNKFNILTINITINNYLVKNIYGGLLHIFRIISIKD